MSCCWPDEILSQIWLDLWRMERERQRELGIRMDDGLIITTITTVINFIKSNIILLFAIFTTLEHVGGRHSFWSTGCTPCFPRQTPSSPGGSSARLPLGSPGRVETSQKWQLGSRGWKSCSSNEGEPGVGDPGLWDRHKFLLHIFGGERQRPRLPKPKKGRRDVPFKILAAKAVDPFGCLLKPVDKWLFVSLVWM